MFTKILMKIDLPVQRLLVLIDVKYEKIKAELVGVTERGYLHKNDYIWLRM